MPVGTPFHERTLALCESLNYREWSGYYTVSAYGTHHDHEYSAIRNAAALIDVSPLFKYSITGRDAARLVNRVITRDVAKMGVGQVFYTPWCDEHGHVIDDGTVARLDEDRFRLTAADPSMRWLLLNRAGLQVEIAEVSEQLAAVALQGPAAARVLRACADVDVEALKYFRIAAGHVRGSPAEISRTGYTGDLGYEIWVCREHAIAVWDALMEAGQRFNIAPAGMLALDVARVEAGLLLIDVDFSSSKKALIPRHKYSPYEMGLGRLVDLDKAVFVGRDALAAEHVRGPRRMVVGLEIDWQQIESLHDDIGLVPVAPTVASRVAVPVRQRGIQVGRATTTTWSPMLKRLIALATVDAPHFERGTMLQFEVTVEGMRHFVDANVVRTPFFNRPHKTATPPL